MPKLWFGIKLRHIYKDDRFTDYYRMCPLKKNVRRIIYSTHIGGMKKNVRNEA
jgi:hypothetical protein